MTINWTNIKNLIRLKARFAMTGALATSVDYFLYLFLVNRIFPPVVANIVSYSCSVVINFLLQKRFVFQLKGSASRAFAGSMLVSLGGLALSTGIIWSLNHLYFFEQRQYLTKLCATGLVFFYNFYFKRYVFEQKFI